MRVAECGLETGGHIVSSPLNPRNSVPPAHRLIHHPPTTPPPLLPRPLDRHAAAFPPPSLHPFAKYRRSTASFSPFPASHVAGLPSWRL
ncbi:MAG: hypothetical protein IPL78_35775 [Chloroflexi bacterium]|nr:hypothetical protein [Chloroflexota bacterium]